MVVVLEIGFQPFVELVSSLMSMQVYVLVFHASPEPLDEYVIQRATDSVHADPDPRLL